MANISASFSDFSSTAASNQPDQADSATVGADLRQLTATLKSVLEPLSTVAGTNTITAACAGLTAYYSGAYEFVPANTNTGATTININSIGAKNIFWNGAACVGGELRQNIPVRLVYDGTQFHVISSGFNAPFLDTHPVVQGSADSTKKVRIEADGLTTGATRVWTAPDSDLNFNGLTGTQSANTIYAGPTSGAAALPAFRAPVGADGASLVLIQRQSASNSATIDFTTGIDSAYDCYVVKVDDLIPATDATELRLRVSEDGGSTFKAGGTDYAHTRNVNTDAGTGSGAGSTGDGAIVIAAFVSNSKALSCSVEFGAPSGTSRHKMFRWHADYETSGNTITVATGAGVFKLDTNAINGIRFLMSSGNITNGIFSLYGLRKS